MEKHDTPPRVPNSPSVIGVVRASRAQDFSSSKPDEVGRVGNRDCNHYVADAVAEHSRDRQCQDESGEGEDHVDHPEHDVVEPASVVGRQ